MKYFFRINEGLKSIVVFFFLVLSLQSCGSSGSGGNNSANSVYQVQISWTANAGEQTGFYVEQSEDEIEYTQVQTIPDGTTTAGFNGLTSKTTYYFRVQGYNEVGISPYSKAVSFTPK